MDVCYGNYRAARGTPYPTHSISKCALNHQSDRKVITGEEDGERESEGGGRGSQEKRMGREGPGERQIVDTGCESVYSI